MCVLTGKELLVNGWRVPHTSTRSFSRFADNIASILQQSDQTQRRDYEPLIKYSGENRVKFGDKRFGLGRLITCAAVGGRVPGTGSTQQPLICGTERRTACVAVADRRHNRRLRARSRSARRQSHAAKQTDWLSAPSHTHTHRISQAAG